MTVPTRAEIQTLFDRRRMAWDARDPDGLAATHSPDGVINSPMFGEPATGRQFKIEGARIHVLKDGLVEHERRLYDFTGLLIQVGVLKGKPGA